MKLLLTAISGSREGQTITILDSESVSFGRTSVCDLSFESDLHMSSRHFKVTNTGEYAQLEDLGSTNGTWLNTEKIQSERLREGDRIRAGTTILTVEFITEPSSYGSGGASPVERDRTHAPAQNFSSATPQIPLRESQHSHGGDSGDRAEAMPLPSSESGAGRLTPFGDSIEFEQPPPDNVPLGRGDGDARDSVGPFRAAPEGTATPRGENPFDSFDGFEPSQDVAASMGNAGATSNAGDHDTPFGESSYNLQVPRDLVRPAKLVADAGFRLLSRRTEEEASDSFAILVDSLSRKWSIQLILHFHKVRNAPPPFKESRVLFNWLPESAHCYSPVQVGWAEVYQNPLVMAILPRLCRADACIAVMGKSAADLFAQVAEMQAEAVEGFSEAGGFLPIYWPSSMALMIDASGGKICRSLFADRIAGVLMCSPCGRNNLVSTASGELAADLAAVQFSPVGRLLGT